MIETNKIQGSPYRTKEKLEKEGKTKQIKPNYFKKQRSSSSFLFT
jgi:hypothetical protein